MKKIPKKQPLSTKKEILRAIEGNDLDPEGFIQEYQITEDAVKLWTNLIPGSEARSAFLRLLSRQLIQEYILEKIKSESRSIDQLLDFLP